MEQVNVVLDSVRSFLVQLGEFLPKLLAAIIILIAGWLIARLLSFVIVKGLKLVNFNVITEKAGIDKFLKQGTIKKTTIDILGLLGYWLVILGTLLIAFNIMGLGVVSELFSRIVQFIPNVMVSVLILAIGLYFARFVADAVVAYSKNVGVVDYNLIGRVTYYAITIFVILIALNQVSIGGKILEWTYFILLSGIVLALAIAFGIGGQKWASGQLDKFMKGKGR